MSDVIHQAGEQWPPERNERVAEIIRSDVLTNLGQIFASGPDIEHSGFAFDSELTPDEAPLRNRAATGLAWTYRGAHVATFVGLEPTGRMVTIDGFTVLHGSAVAPLIRRYIDWHQVFAHLGALPGRPIVDFSQKPRPAPADAG